MARISRHSLSDRVTDEILAIIENRPIGVGEALPPTRELAEIFDVSVVVVREALATLAGRGIIRRGQGREPVVTRPGVEVLDTIFRTRMHQDAIPVDEFQQCRAALEAQSAASAALGGDAARAVATLNERVDALAAASDREAFAEADLQFHRSLAELSGNRALSILLDALGSLVRESLLEMYERVADEPAALARAVDHHREIAAAVAVGDPHAAVAAMRTHFEESAHGNDFSFMAVKMTDAVAR